MRKKRDSTPALRHGTVAPAAQAWTTASVVLPAGYKAALREAAAGLGIEWPDMLRRIIHAYVKDELKPKCAHEWRIEPSKTGPGNEWECTQCGTRELARIMPSATCAAIARVMHGKPKEVKKEEIEWGGSLSSEVEWDGGMED